MGAAGGHSVGSEILLRSFGTASDRIDPRAISAMSIIDNIASLARPATSHASASGPPDCDPQPGGEAPGRHHVGEHATPFMKRDQQGVVRVHRLDETVGEPSADGFRAKRAEQAIEDDRNAAEIAVEIGGVAAVNCRRGQKKFCLMLA